MSVLDTLIFGYRKVALSGIALFVTRNTLNFVSGATAVDNPLTLQTDVTVTGGGQGGWNAQAVYNTNATLNVPSPGAGFAGTSQPFSNHTYQYAVKFPTFARGVLVKMIHSSGDAAGSPIAFSDPAGNLIQDPQNLNLIATYSWQVSLACYIWEAVVGDPVNGNYWAAVG